jgi:uncharacterized protein
MSAENNPRIAILDVLRGFAIVSILLLHNVEHFDFYFKPEGQPEWLDRLDQLIWDILFFLFSGKSYAIFAFLFGVTFYLQSAGQAKKGQPFAARFSRRMLILLGFGLLNSCFFQGDILSIYAVIGLALIFFENRSNRTIFITALFLMLQPWEWGRAIYVLITPGIDYKDPLSWTYFGLANEYFAHGSFWEVVTGNLTNGKKAVLLWNWENGRIFQTLALFLLGFLAGRKKLFITSPENTAWWKNSFWMAFLTFGVLFFIVRKLPGMQISLPLLSSLQTIFSSWSNFSFMMVLMSSIVLLYQKGALPSFFQFLIPLGKMSLTNYILQSIIGSFIYYGFGLGLYQFTGATKGVLIGLGLVFVTRYLCARWLKSHNKGVLEGLWHRWTWGKQP